MDTVNETVNQVVRPHRMDDKGNEQPLTWADLKNFANALSEEQLSQPVRTWREEFAATVFAVEVAVDDLINPSGDGLEPRAVYSQSDDAADQETAQEEPVVYPKGSIFLALKN